MTRVPVSEFASRPLVRKCIASPRSPHSVLSFWLGFDVTSDEKREKFADGSYVSEMIPLWFGGGPDFDELCRHFIPVVRDAGKGLLRSTTNTDGDDDEQDWDWDDVDGKLARLILCDQLPRNVFRGEDEAFAYEEMSLEIARELGSSAMLEEPSFHGSYTFFLVVALMHAENLKDHELGYQLIDKGKETCPDIGWEGTRRMFLQHTEVVEKFGRYPYRNIKKGRVSTKEELDWLKSDDVPMWARSQG